MKNPSEKRNCSLVVLGGQGKMRSQQETGQQGPKLIDSQQPCSPWTHAQGPRSLLGGAFPLMRSLPAVLQLTLPRCESPVTLLLEVLFGW